MKNDNLKACPFCGGAVHLDCTTAQHPVYGGRGPRIYGVRCPNHCIYIQYTEDKDASVEAWNSRPIEDDLRARIAELQQQLADQCEATRAAEERTGRLAKSARMVCAQMRGYMKAITGSSNVSIFVTETEGIISDILDKPTAKAGGEGGVPWL
jgi:hypothetical protein